MLLELGLRNFKAFGDEFQTALFSKINLIYGPNSGGKSSLIQALLMLKQSRKEDYETSNRADEPTGKLKPRGEYVDLGSFSALIHKHDTQRDMEIALSYTGRGYSRDRPRKRINAEKVTAQITFSQVRASRLSDIVGMKYQISHGGSTIFDGLWESHLDENHRIAIRKALTIANIEIPPDLIAISHLGFLPYLYVPGLTPEGGVNWQQASSQESLVGLVRELENRLTPELVDLLRSLTSRWSYDSVLDSITYLGPLRSYPERIYTVSSKNRNSTGVRGEFTSELLYSSPESIEKANKWFERFGIPYILAVDKFGDVALTGEYVSVALVDKHTNTTVTLADVGFGINQLLPVIVEGLTPPTPRYIFEPQNSIICIEQPEIHLHPRLQAEVADLLIETSREDRGKQWIIETHSELLMRRIQRRIEEGILSPSDVSVIYVAPHEDAGSKIELLRLDEDGDFIDDWPSGFFEEGYNELMGSLEKNVWL